MSVDSEFDLSMTDIEAANAVTPSSCRRCAHEDCANDARRNAREIARVMEPERADARRMREALQAIHDLTADGDFDGTDFARDADHIADLTRVGLGIMTQEEIDEINEEGDQ